MAPVALESQPAAAGPNTNGHTASSAAPAVNGKANGHAAAAAEQYAFATRALHVGSEPSADTGAVIPAISLSTTFKQDGVGNHKGFEYSRSGNPNRDAFERAVASLEGGEHGLAFSSGSAVTATILAALPPQSHVVSVNDVYGGTYRYFTKVASAAQNVTTTFVDLEDNDAEGGLEARIRAAIRPEQTRLLWIETPTNPTLRLVDIARVSALAKSISPSIRIVVDNTFLSSWYQAPLSLGADIVVHSVTKYLNGHSDVVMGVAVTSDKEWFEKLQFLQNAIGAVPSAFDSWLALRGLKTLSIRMRQHGENALAIAHWLERRTDLIEAVIYPGLPSHPAHAIAVKQIAPQARAAWKAAHPDAAADPQAGFAYGGMLSFRFKGDPTDDAQAERFLRRLKLFTLAESLGGVESLVELPSKMTHGSVSPEDRKKLGIEHNFVRISVGIEDVNDLIRDLEQALEPAAAAGKA